MESLVHRRYLINVDFLPSLHFGCNSLTLWQREEPFQPHRNALRITWGPNYKFLVQSLTPSVPGHKCVIVWNLGSLTPTWGAFPRVFSAAPARLNASSISGPRGRGWVGGSQGVGLVWEPHWRHGGTLRGSLGILGASWDTGSSVPQTPRLGSLSLLALPSGGCTELCSESLGPLPADSPDCVSLPALPALWLPR